MKDRLEMESMKQKETAELQGRKARRRRSVLWDDYKHDKHWRRRTVSNRRNTRSNKECEFNLINKGDKLLIWAQRISNRTVFVLTYIHVHTHAITHTQAHTHVYYYHMHPGLLSCYFCLCYCDQFTWQKWLWEERLSGLWFLEGFGLTIVGKTLMGTVLPTMVRA